VATNKRVGSRQLNQVVQGITSKVYGKYGFLNGTIIKDWEKIVGSEYVHSIYPEKITFSAGKRNHGTLIVKASSHSTALIFQHIHSYIIDRINMYYGYRAIDKIKVIVGKIDINLQNTEKPKEIDISEEKEKSIETLIGNIDNQDLKDSLKRLGRVIYAKGMEKK
jgi:hypothetical protein